MVAVGSLETGALLGKADVVTLADSCLGVLGGVVDHEVLEWVIDLRGGKRVLVPNLNPWALFSSYEKRWGEVCSMGQK